MSDKDEIFYNAHNYLAKGLIDEAIAEYLKILPVSTDGNIHNIIGDLLVRKDAKEEAVKYYKDAAILFSKEESYAKAIAIYNKILSINPDQHDALIKLAELNAERGFIQRANEYTIRVAELYYAKGLPLKALSIYKKALSFSPSNTVLKIKMADLQLRINYTEKAVNMYLAIAMEYEANAESVKAEEMYKKVVTLDPDNLDALVHLSRLAEDDQDFALAFEYISRAVALAPHNNDIKFDFTNLAEKANIDISEFDNSGESQEVQEEDNHPPDSKSLDQSEHHQPLHLSDEHNEIKHQPPVSVSPDSESPEPVSSLGVPYEETGYVPEDHTSDIGSTKKGIWDEMRQEDSYSSSAYEQKPENAGDDGQVQGNNYQNPADFEPGMQSKENLQEISDHNSRRLKRRVKTNKVHMALIFFIVSVTGLSFFFTYKYFEARQTVDVETPKREISTTPPNISEADKTNESFDLHSTKANNQDKADTDTKPEAADLKEHEPLSDEGIIVLPERESAPPVHERQAESEATNTPPLKGDLSSHMNLEDKQETSSVTEQDDIEVAEAVHEPVLTGDGADTISNTEGTATQTDFQHFSESFDDNGNRWDIVQTAAAYARISDGKYYIRNQRDSGAYVILNGPDVSTHHEFEILTKMTTSSSDEHNSSGLIFGAKNKEDYFVLLVTSENTYSIRKYYRDVPLELAEGPINDDSDSEFRLQEMKITASEGRLNFFINDSLIQTIPDISFTDRKTGFFVEGKAEIAVDELLIRQQFR